MNEKILDELGKKLEKDRIPSKLLKDHSALSVLLEPPVTDIEIYGDIFFARYEADKEENGLLILNWEVMDITDEPDEVHGNLCIALSMLNSALPAGGYAIDVSDPESGEEGEAGQALIYRISLPVGLVNNEEWLLRETYEAVETSAAVLKATAEPLIGFSKGEISEDEFRELIL